MHKVERLLFWLFGMLSYFKIDFDFSHFLSEVMLRLILNLWFLLLLEAFTDKLLVSVERKNLLQ